MERPVISRVHFIRHGEGFHNTHARDWRAHGKEGNPYTHSSCPIDPELTPKGVAQAEALHAKVQRDFPDQEPEVVYTSPMRRAVMTALGAFKHRVAARNLRFLATDLAHEEGGLHRGDLRLSRSQLSKEFPRVDFGGVVEEDPLWSDTVRETPAHMADRAHELLSLIMEGPESTVAVAAHSSFLLTTFNVCLKAGGEDTEALTRWFDTGEMRTVHLRVVSRPPPDFLEACVLQ